jgi:hypothetical protein
VPITLTPIVQGGQAQAGPPGAQNIVVGTFNWAFGVYEELVQGNPAPPSLGFKFPAGWSASWGLSPGMRSIQVYVLQAANTSPRPSLTVLANTAVGVAANLVAYAPSGTGWVSIGPLAFTATAAGVVTVQLASNSTAADALPCYFDHIVVT